MSDVMLETVGLKKHYPLTRALFGGAAPMVRAVDDVSLKISRGRTLGLVGESGSGKSTFGRTLLRLEDATAGDIMFDGTAITTAKGAVLKALRSRMQMVFQDPFSSLNPRMTVESILATPMRFNEPGLDRAARRRRMEQAMARVGLPDAYLSRYPHEFSGGQRQRIGIARALIVGPEFLVADEAVSALDVSVQAQVLNLFAHIKADLGLTLLFITHDLAVVGHIADQVAVMYLGRVVEVAPTRRLFRTPQHPYSEALLSAAPTPDPGLRRDRVILKGDMPSPVSPPSGCAFRTRCRYALPACAGERPALRPVAADHQVACIRDDITLSAHLPQTPSERSDP